MFHKIQQNNNFGSFESIVFLFKYLLSSRSMKVVDIERYCIGQSVELAYCYKGVLDLLEFLTWVIIDSNGEVYLSEFGLYAQEKNDDDLKIILLKILFQKFIDNNVLDRFLDINKIKFDVIASTASIGMNLIPLDFSGIRNLLISIGFFVYNRTSSTLLISIQYLKYFVEEIIPILILYSKNNKTTISLERLRELQLYKSELGDDAEDFVLTYELQRLNDHNFIDQIKIISKIDVNAGYDIVSFLNKESKLIDKYIEVKSFAERLNFYWSRNEVDVAKLKKDQYFLYLVDRIHLETPNYEPIIIQNPYDKIINPSWIIEVESWHIRPSDKMVV